MYPAKCMWICFVSVQGHLGEFVDCELSCPCVFNCVEGCVTKRFRERVRPSGQPPLLEDINPLFILETTHTFHCGGNCAHSGCWAALKGLTLYMVVSVTGSGPFARSAPTPAEGWQTELLWDGPWGELSLRRSTQRLCAHPRVPWHKSNLSAVLATPPKVF